MAIQMPSMGPGGKFTVQKVNSIYVGNVPEFYTEKLIKDMFASYGAITNVSTIPPPLA